MWSISSGAQSIRFINAHTLCIKLLWAIVFISGCQSTPAPEAVTNAETSGDPAPVIPSTELSPLDQSRFERAQALLVDSRPSDAVKILSELSRQYRNNNGILINLATAYYLLGDLDNSQRILGMQVIPANSADVLNLRGLIAVAEQRFKDAENYYTNALKTDNRHAEARFNLALLYDIYFQDIERAYYNYAEYLKLVPDDQETIDWLDQLKYSLDRG